MALQPAGRQRGPRNRADFVQWEPDRATSERNGTEITEEEAEQARAYRRSQEGSR